MCMPHALHLASVHQGEASRLGREGQGEAVRGVEDALGLYFAEERVEGVVDHKTQQARKSGEGQVGAGVT